MPCDCFIYRLYILILTLEYLFLGVHNQNNFKLMLFNMEGIIKEKSPNGKDWVYGPRKLYFLYGRLCYSL